MWTIFTKWITFPYSSNLEHKMLVLKSDCYAFSLFSSFKMKTHETFFRNTMIFSRFLRFLFFSEEIGIIRKMFVKFRAGSSGYLRRTSGYLACLKSSRDDGGCGRAYPFQQKFQGLFWQLKFYCCSSVLFYSSSF